MPRLRESRRAKSVSATTWAVKHFVETNPLDETKSALEAAHEHRLSRRAVLVP